MKITPKQYAKLIMDIDEPSDDMKISEWIEKIAMLIKKNRDEAKLGRIISEIDKNAQKESGMLDVYASSAIDLSNENLQRIKDKISTKRGISQDKINIIQQIDKGLIGGVKFKIGNKLIDGSIKSKLKQLQNSLA